MTFDGVEGDRSERRTTWRRDRLPGMLAILFLAAVMAPGMAGAGEAPSPRSGVTVLEHTGKWESGYGAKFYNVVGRVKNGSDTPVLYVKLRVEAVNDGGRTIAEAVAYNEGAEALSAPGATLEGVRTAGKLRPLGPGEEQRFRASFLEEDAPDVTAHTVRVIEAPAQQ